MVHKVLFKVGFWPFFPGLFVGFKVYPLVNFEKVKMGNVKMSKQQNKKLGFR